MHILSDQYRSEFLATPELVRATLAIGDVGREPTLLIKSSTLSIKYLIIHHKIRLIFTLTADRKLAYGVDTQDEEPSKSGVIWSLVETAEEIDTLRRLNLHHPVKVFLFNELTVSIARSTQIFANTSGNLEELLLEANLHAGATPRLPDLFDAARERSGLDPQSASSDAYDATEWQQLDVLKLKNDGSVSKFTILGLDEGGQQEEVAVWLIDNLQPSGVILRPQVHEARRVRELTDLLMTYEFGAFLIESKALSILGRDSLPTREKLTSDLRKHLTKAVAQLTGALRSIKRGLVVTSTSEEVIDIDSSMVPHLIVLVPDLSLLGDSSDFGGGFFREIASKAQAFLHILDPAELLRVVQAAEILAKRSNDENTTKMHAFDYYLVERTKVAVNASSPHFEVLLRHK